MKIIDFMSFSPDWFLTLPGMLITGGVVLLLIALIILLTSNKKNDNEKEGKIEESDLGAVPPVSSGVETQETLQPAQNETLNSAPAPTQGLNDTVAPATVDLNTPSIDQSVQAPIQQEPIDFTAMTTPQSVQPTPVSVDMPAAPSFDAPVAPAPVENIAPAAPAIDDAKPSVSVYGGVSPVDTVKPVEQAAPVIYGGADPLENTAPIPKVENHTLYNQPEAKVVEPAQQFGQVAPAAVETKAPSIPDLSASTFGPMSAPAQAPVEQPTIQTTVTPAAEPAQTPIVKEDIETLDF